MVEIFKKLFRKVPHGYLVDEEENYHPLNMPLTTKIGRGRNCHIKVTDDLHVSREHALILYDQKGKKFFIKDLGSKHGTFVNGTEVKEGEERELKEGDHIRLGKTSRFTFKLL
ncbi:MAG: FHA domain-containing protein [Caldiserica bacterium]|nr:FHA domain-containing protein [Caldisericota bacterium]